MKIIREDTIEKNKIMKQLVKQNKTMMLQRSTKPEPVLADWCWAGWISYCQLHHHSVGWATHAAGCATHAAGCATHTNTKTKQRCFIDQQTQILCWRTGVGLGGFYYADRLIRLAKDTEICASLLIGQI